MSRHDEQFSDVWAQLHATRHHLKAVVADLNYALAEIHRMSEMLDKLYVRPTDDEGRYDANDSSMWNKADDRLYDQTEPKGDTP